MKLNIKDILYWMDTIRGSEDRDKTLESFWKGQVLSKVWLCERLKEVHKMQRIIDAKVLICGGWNGVMATLLFNSEISVSKILSIDIDEDCKKIAYEMNKEYEIKGRFKAETCDMLNFKNYNDYDIIINTVCEHMTQEDFNKWITLLPKNKTIICQSNNFSEGKGHINCKNSLTEFAESTDLEEIRPPVELKTQKYTRYMIIGCNSPNSQMVKTTIDDGNIRNTDPKALPKKGGFL